MYLLYTIPAVIFLDNVQYMYIVCDGIHRQAIERAHSWEAEEGGGEGGSGLHCVFICHIQRCRMIYRLCSCRLGYLI